MCQWRPCAWARPHLVGLGVDVHGARPELNGLVFEDVAEAETSDLQVEKSQRELVFRGRLRREDGFRRRDPDGGLSEPDIRLRLMGPFKSKDIGLCIIENLKNTTNKSQKHSDNEKGIVTF